METLPRGSSEPAKRPMKLFERLLDTDAKADLLTLFHNNANLADTPEGLAKRVGRSPVEVERELEDLVELGILKKVQVFSFGVDRDKEIQDAISKQLALGEVPQFEGMPRDLSRGSAGQVPRSPTGLEVLDKTMPDGLPAICTLLILSDPGAGEENLVAYFVSKHVREGQAVLYITLDNFPANIRQIAQSQSPEAAVDWMSLVLVDCYSNTVGVESEEPHIADPENLSAISIAVADVMSKQNISLIVVDSFNTLIRKRGFRSAAEFLRVLVARTRQGKCQCLVTMNRKAFHPAMVAGAQDTVDGVIELKTEESQEGLARSLRVLKLVGTKHLTTWMPYDISDEGRFVQNNAEKTTRSQ
jgi:KaiC/GvpD/RAD55 family RecA-like ATPase